MPGGRPSDYSTETTAIICARLADGESLRSICRDAEMPDLVTVYRWIGKYPEFSQQYARAREDQADTLAEQIIDIADNVENDTNEDGSVNQDNIQRARLRVDARKWVASKLKPKKYGDRQEIVGDADKPIIVQIIKFGQQAVEDKSKVIEGEVVDGAD